MTRARANIFGFSGILQWALLALLTIGSAPVPPLLLNAMCFGIGGTIGLGWAAANGRLSVLRSVPVKVYAFGTLGLFGAHLMYFTAFRLAPSAETGLIAYLWPILIVLLSGLLPGERLLPMQVIGGLVAFAGATLIVLAGGFALRPESLMGYTVAFAFALTWATYSVTSRRLGQVPTEAVAIYCLAAALLSALAHSVVEPTIWPQSTVGWASVLALGIGPVGIAFFVWDIGMKAGNIQLLGVLAYAAPLLSTLALVFAGKAQASPQLGAAACLITLGAVLAARSGAARRVSAG